MLRTDGRTYGRTDRETWELKYYFRFPAYLYDVDYVAGPKSTQCCTFLGLAVPIRYLIVGQTRCQIVIVSCLSTVSIGPLGPENKTNFKIFPK